MAKAEGHPTDVIFVDFSKAFNKVLHGRLLGIMRLLKPLWVTHGSLSKDQNIDRPIYSLDIHPDGSRLATGGVIDTCGVVILWNMVPIRNPSLEMDASTPRKLFQMDSHQACVNCVRWSPSGRWLASAGMDKVIMIWTRTAATSRQTTVFGSKEQTKFTEHWRCSSVLRGHTGDIIDLAWSQDGRKLASASVDNNVIVWCRLSTATGAAPGQFSLLTTLRGHRGFVKGVAWDPIGRYLATQGDDVAVNVWRTSDWQIEANIKKPFAKATGQSQVMRISWSLDGSTIAAPHAINNGFPTAKLIDRTNWMPSLDLVGHRKHVTCARYNPNVFRKVTNGESHSLVCLALGSKDRSVSVWTTAARRALVAIHDLFTNSVCDLTWSADGQELMACSLDGTVSYMCFKSSELGTPWATSELVRLHHKAYGQSLLEKFDPEASEAIGLPKSVCTAGAGRKPSGNLNQSDIILETPEALALQQTQAVICKRLKENAESNTSSSLTRPPPAGPSKQIETRGKDGRRRIIPKFLGHLDAPDEDSNPQFSSPPQSAQQASRSPNQTQSTSAGIRAPTTPRPAESTSTRSLLSHALSSPNATTTSPKASGVANRTPVQEALRMECNFSKTQELSKNSSPDKNERCSSSKDTELPKPPSCVTIAVDTVSQPQITTASSESGASRKRAVSDVDMETAVDQSGEEIRRKIGRQKKKRRVRLFLEPDEESTSAVVDKKAAATHSKSSASGDNTANTSLPKLKIATAVESETAVRAFTSESRANGTVPTHNRTPFLINTPDQLVSETKIKFVCSHPVDGPILMELSSVTSPTVGTRAAPALPENVGINRISASRGDRPLWEIVSEKRLTAYSYTDNLVSLGDLDGRIRLLYSTGGCLCPPIMLDSPIHLLALSSLDSANDPPEPETGKTANNPTSLSRLHTVVSGGAPVSGVPGSQTTGRNTNQYRLVALCQSGRLTIWHLNVPAVGFSSTSILYSPSVFPQFVVECSLCDLFTTSQSAYSSMSFGPNGQPVVHKRDGSSYMFHIEGRMWLEMFDGSNPTRCSVALTTARSCPPGPLASCQLLTKTIGATSDNLKASDNPTNHRLVMQNFLASQTNSAKIFGSSAEYRYWLTRWFRHLVEDNEEEQLRSICQDLIGPVFSGSRTSWQPVFKGIGKHELVRELLTLFALNMRLQRLYVELKEMLEQCSSESSLLT
ncbi:Protein HIRA [Fasciola hepatica]|uniref:Protein HIRA n=1 Tax=Fasciola hepatica TaxID=6192 RepID=A0A4E0RQP4_FASHE|nr:Protein HIRA [Fasciola hepatica]